jgi:hypothetical protein
LPPDALLEDSPKTGLLEMTTVHLVNQLFSVSILGARREITMSLTLENLHKRLLKLEQEMASLQQSKIGNSLEKSPLERGRSLLRQARLEKQDQKAAMLKAFAQMGTIPAPVAPEQLRQMMAACGVRPEDNLFSRSIQEMREE